MQEYDYPIGGPCGWMWARKKEPSLAQDNNPNHLTPKGFRVQTTYPEPEDVNLPFED